MNQHQLFFETVFDAIGADISAAGGFKTVASKLWPAESLTTSTARLRNSINPEQAQKLCPHEVLQIKRLAKEAGSTATIDFEAQQLSYQVTWVQPEDQLERLERENNELFRAIIERQKRIEALKGRESLRSVK